MKARLKKAAVSLLAAMLLLAMALPAASQEPENEAPPSPTTQDATADQDPTAGGDPVPPNSTTVEDFVRVTNPDGSGDAEVRLDGSAGDGSTQWDLENDATAGNQLQFLHGFGTPQWVLTPGGFMGLGTTSPQDPFHIANTGNDHLLLEDTDGASFNIEAGGDFFDIDSTDFPLNNFRIHRSAPSNALVVNQGVGVGISDPAEALDIRNVTGDPDATRFRIQHGEDHWINGINQYGTYIFAKFGTGGIELRVRDRNHFDSTFDVEGPVEASAFKTSSSSALKTGTRPVDPLDVLASLNALPISSWQFKSCADGEGRLPHEDGTPARPCSGPGEGPRHIGPMAEDFQEAFGLGDGESIATVDADGVIMASLQGLTQLMEEKLEEKDERIAELEEQVSDLESLEARVNALEAQLRRGGPLR